MIFKTSLIHQVYVNNHVNIIFNVLVYQLIDQYWVMIKTKSFLFCLPFKKYLN
jgi:hypothetical protein